VNVDSEVRIRQADSADLAAVVEIERSAFSDPWTLESFRSALSLSHFRFLIAEGAAVEILGYIIIVIVSPEAEIANVAVGEAGRRGGVGRRLVVAGLELARSERVKNVYLEVRESNSAAQRLYEQVGFELIGRRKGYYERPREDALVLRCDFDDA
jgi:ribosomal-protein-alanine N-acetyltransferase